MKTYLLSHLYWLIANPSLSIGVVISSKSSRIKSLGVLTLTVKYV